MSTAAPSAEGTEITTRQKIVGVGLLERPPYWYRGSNWSMTSSLLRLRRPRCVSRNSPAGVVAAEVSTAAFTGRVHALLGASRQMQAGKSVRVSGACMRACKHVCVRVCVCACALCVCVRWQMERFHDVHVGPVTSMRAGQQ